MIIRQVTAQGDVEVPLEVRGASGSAREVQAVVDTGFSELISLPESLIRELGLVPIDQATMCLADGTLISVDVFIGFVRWFGEWREVEAVRVEGVPLIGLALLRGSRISIDAVEHGRVSVEPLAGLHSL